MGRPAKFPEDRILDMAAELCAAEGVEAVTASGVARALGAPSGSIYHRFSGRAELRATLWCRTQERFQASYLGILEGVDDPAAAIAAGAVHAVRWCRANPAEARILILHRREEFVAPELPEALLARAAALEAGATRILDHLARALHDGPTDYERLHFIAIGVPLAAMRPYLERDGAIPPSVDSLVDDAIMTLLGG
ncbi:TetR/AcrR family transcriptional regulator [Oceanibacterium hippocampi]|uniref:Bacterial regulatory proteins, tetR family n=1 Tax=Oceanibacterium hippocampi TaxID=745714 RepID=A0A1Y5SHK0_9PROT|nr:TetR/AcrR family transcriptional regulator [Oceanibacterium hippocampi]SLN38013.1 Bacterial regulatory proteins, tetR family [Oceanibacterium hippocampi]